MTSHPGASAARPRWSSGKPSRQYLVWRLAAASVPTFPEPLDAALASLIGSIAYAANAPARAAVRQNLGVITPRLGRVGRERLVRRVFVMQSWNYLKTFRIPRLSREALLRRIDVAGWEHLEAARRLERGVIFASAHLGPLVLVGQVVAALGQPIAVLAEALEPRLFELLNRRLRGSFGVSFVPQDQLLTIRRVLEHGGAIGVLGDRAVTGTGLRVPFFGREALLPVGHILLAMRTGAPLLPSFAVRGERLRAEILPPLQIEPGRGDELTRRNLMRWAALLERYIAAAPGEWAVFEPVWERARGQG